MRELVEEIARIYRGYKFALRCAAPKLTKAMRGEAWGILNPWGDLWTHQTFQSEGDGHQYLNRYWREFPNPNFRSAAGFRVVPVRVTVSVAREANADTGHRDGPSVTDPGTNQPLDPIEGSAS